MLTKTGCEKRQWRLRERMEQNRWDCFVTGNFRTVYYLTGVLSLDVPTVFALFRDGRSVLVTSSSQSGAAGELVPLETYSITRDITQPVQDAANLLRRALSSDANPTVSSYAVERAATPGLVEAELSKLWLKAPVDDASLTLRHLRKRKEEDEIDEIRASLRLCEDAYHTAREVICVGATEIDVFNAMQAAVVQTAGTSVRLEGDFACGERAIKEGGVPTPRKIAEGDLYILDLFPAPALYAGDTCRTFAVTTPTDLQCRAHEVVQQALRLAEAEIRPGVRAASVYSKVKQFLDSQSISENSFWHHAGHGIGHDGHESPRIIPGSEEIFEVGDVIAVEPGIYSKNLQGGIRIENDYVVKEGGLENLFDFPSGL